MALRTVAGLFYVSLLMFGGVRSKADQIDNFSRAGENITLPCQRVSHYGPRCSEVEWSYYKTRSSPIFKVSGGEVLDSRLTLNSNCSLSVQSVTVEDTGLYFCRQKDTYDVDTIVYLSVLTVSPAPPEPKCQSFTLQCTLWRYYGHTCSAGTLVWLDQNQEVLYEEQRNCESYLTVELQSPHSRTFTCQYKEEGKVQVSAEYSLMRERVQPEKGVRSEAEIDRFSRAGENTTLPCQRVSHYGPRCSEVEWIYYKTRSSFIFKVSGGKVLDSRLALNSDCSLSVPSVTKEDTGVFLCRQKDTTGADTIVYLSVLTVSPAPPEPKCQSFTLQCTLWRYYGHTCSAGTLVWLDQNQEVLSGEQRNCESYLTVELQSPHNRTFTCQYKEEGKVQVSAEYSLMRERVQPEKGWSWFLVLKTLSWTGLIITTVVVSICTRDGKRTKSNRKRVPDYENETDL